MNYFKCPKKRRNSVVKLQLVRLRIWNVLNNLSVIIYISAAKQTAIAKLDGLF